MSEFNSRWLKALICHATGSHLRGRLQDNVPSRFNAGHFRNYHNVPGSLDSAVSLSLYHDDVFVMRTLAQMHKQSPVSAADCFPSPAPTLSLNNALSLFRTHLYSKPLRTTGSAPSNRGLLSVTTARYDNAVGIRHTTLFTVR